MRASRTPKALIADDEPALRAELERLLADSWPDLAIAASVGDGAAALEAIDRLKPDVAFLDIRMPPPSGLDVAREHRLIDNFMWANDYPHHEGTWPHSAEAIERTMGQLSDGERAKILGLNAARVFGFEIPERYRGQADIAALTGG